MVPPRLMRNSHCLRKLLNRHKIHQQLLDALGLGDAYAKSSIPLMLRLRKMVPSQVRQTKMENLGEIMI